MSYSVMTPCWACGQVAGNGGQCTDGQKLQEGVNAMYQNCESHKGSGTIVLSCTKMEQRQPVQPTTYQAATAQAETTPCCSGEAKGE